MKKKENITIFIISIVVLFSAIILYILAGLPSFVPINDIDYDSSAFESFDTKYVYAGIDNISVKCYDEDRTAYTIFSPYYTSVTIDYIEILNKEKEIRYLVNIPEMVEAHQEIIDIEEFSYQDCDMLNFDIQLYASDNKINPYDFDNFVFFDYDLTVMPSPVTKLVEYNSYDIVYEYRSERMILHHPRLYILDSTTTFLLEDEIKKRYF